MTWAKLKTLIEYASSYFNVVIDFPPGTVQSGQDKEVLSKKS